MDNVGIKITHDVLSVTNETIIAQVISEGAVRNSTLLGAGTEKLFSDVLSSNLPRRFSISSRGALVGAQGEMTSETDLIVHDGQPATSMNLVPCESVIATIEVKRSLRSGLLKKAIADALKVKTLTRRKTELLESDGNGPTPSVKEIVYPFFTHCSLVSVLEQDSLSQVSQKWHQHYFDVPFGCQLDSILCLQTGMVSLAAWYPDLGYPQNCYSPVYGVQLFEENPAGRSIVLFPDFFGKKPLRVRVTPRLDFQVGTAFFLAETQYGKDSLSAWLHFLSSYIQGVLALNGQRLSSLGDFQNISNSHNTRFIPLAIAVDANDFTERTDNTIQQGVASLLTWNHKQENPDAGATNT